MTQMLCQCNDEVNKELTQGTKTVAIIKQKAKIES